MFSQFVWSFHGCLGYKLKPLSLVLHIVYTIVIIYIYTICIYILLYIQRPCDVLCLYSQIVATSQDLASKQ